MWHQHVGKVVCIGRNYAAHAKELGNTVPTEPFWFLKPTSAIIVDPHPIELRRDIGAVHHEIELGVVIGKAGRNIAAAHALEHVRGYVLALDLTARDLQMKAKEKGLPWSVAKGMDSFCPVSTRMIDRAAVADPQSLRLSCAVNKQPRQDGRTSDMIFDVARQIENISKYMKLEEGDLILTGTPEGVGPIQPGDIIEGSLFDQNDKSLLSLQFKVIERN